MQFDQLKRREFFTLFGGALRRGHSRARAQQPATPVIGFIDPRSPDGMTERLRGFRQGLKDTGYVEGETVAIEYRWAEGGTAEAVAQFSERPHPNGSSLLRYSSTIFSKVPSGE